MQERTIRFLSSIGIEDYNDFDLDFESITKSKYFPNRFIFSIKKKSNRTILSNFYYMIVHVEHQDEIKSRKDTKGSKKLCFFKG